MAESKSTGPVPALPLPVSQVPLDERARKLARLESLAASLRSAAADCPPNDPEMRSRIMTAGTAAAQLVAHLRREITPLRRCDDCQLNLGRDVLRAVGSCPRFGMVRAGVESQCAAFVAKGGSHG